MLSHSPKGPVMARGIGIQSAAATGHVGEKGLQQRRPSWGPAGGEASLEGTPLTGWEEHKEDERERGAHPLEQCHGHPALIRLQISPQHLTPREPAGEPLPPGEPL